MLKIENLHVSVEGKEILKGVSLEVKKGEVHAIMGPNGSGKSTLSSVIAGNEDYEVTKGNIYFNDENIEDLSAEERAHKGIFMSFQYPVEIPGITVTNFIKTAINSNLKARGLKEMPANEMLKKIREKADLLEIDSVWLQPVMVPKWVRGAPEYAHIETRPGNNISVPIVALGGSISTPSIGISANVVEVKSFKELRDIGRDSVSGKIVFFNRPMDVTLINTFQAYGGSVNQRTQGAVEAAKLGAVGVIVRSMTTTLDNYPHTGSMYYEGLSLSQRIPAAAISTNGAELLSSMLSLNPKIKFFFRQNSRNYPDVLTHTVIGEIKGSEKPDEIIVVGGHLD